MIDRLDIYQRRLRNLKVKKIKRTMFKKPGGKKHTLWKGHMSPTSVILAG